MPTSDISAARRRPWADVIAAERAKTERRRLSVWHHGSPTRGVLDAPDPPTHEGRYHRRGGRQTWYGSSTEAAAWAELVRSLPDGAEPREVTRRLGKAEFDVVVLDLSSPELLRALGLKTADLKSDDLGICQALADLAVDGGFDAVIGPSAALPEDLTLAVFGPAIAAATDVVDLGVRIPPIRG